MLKCIKNILKLNNLIEIKSIKINNLIEIKSIKNK